MAPRSPSPTLQQAFGQAVRAQRRELGLSQEGLGERAGLHRTYISQVERGLKSPSLTTIEHIAKVLGVRPSELLRSAEKLARLR